MKLILALFYLMTFMFILALGVWFIDRLDLMYRDISNAANVAPTYYVNFVQYKDFAQYFLLAGIITVAIIIATRDRGDV